MGVERFTVLPEIGAFKFDSYIITIKEDKTVINCPLNKAIIEFFLDRELKHR